ncbi:MAG: Maf family protein [Clostridium sp.]|nr:Maf family protein [Clostridium sp.]MCM1208052.1 Maf family protein [Ruminococcus sp.]
MRNIILASQSPRRRALMEQAGYTFEIIPSYADEVIADKEPETVVQKLSLLKACDVYQGYAKKMSQGTDAISDSALETILVIGADTVVFIGGNILGKPASVSEAVEMIKSLQGNTHEVYTGVSFVWHDPDDLLQAQRLDTFENVYAHCFCECTRVTCYPMTDKEIEAYVAKGECMDKAGAYGIQGSFGIYIKEICGDYNNVVGLPIARLYHELKALKLQ